MELISILFYNKSQPSGISTDVVTNFLQTKVTAVRDNTAHAFSTELMLLSSVTIDIFDECTIDKLRSVIRSALAKSCEIDPISHFLLIELVNDYCQTFS